MMREEIEIIELNDSNTIQYKTDIMNVMADSYKLNFPNEKYMNSEEKFEKMLTYKREGKAEIFIAARKEKFCGYIWFFVQDIEKIHLNEIAVVRDERSAGIGTKLIAKLEEYAKERNIKNIELFCMEENKSAKNFYSRLGFTTKKRLLVKTITI